MTQFNRFYRPDIDGLRAIAVMSVVIYHSFPTLAPGGFIGVDIFFVISGYLITSIILREQESHAFSLFNFYVRRIRRIFPALCLVLICCLTFGWFDLLKSELVNLGRQTAGGAAFIANWVLYKRATDQGGYFDTETAMKPLAHLWSLGIEEQFYILWPLLIILAYRQSWNLRRMAIALCALSFSLNLVLLPNFKDAVFYLPMTRLWELLVGCLLATRQSRTYHPSIPPLTSLFGLILILGSIFLFNHNQPFPGWRASIPVLGTFLIMAAQKGTWINSKLLSQPVLVGLGLISYPLYLWHWPILYFARLDTNFDSTARALAVVASLLLSCVTYYAIEKRIRHVSRIGPFPVTLCLVILMTGIAIAGRIFVKMQPEGWLYQNGTAAQDLSSLILDKNLSDYTVPGCFLSHQHKEYAPVCLSDKRQSPTALVYGDSRANAIYAGLVAESSPERRWAVVSRPGCGPFLELKRQLSIADKDGRDCARLNSATPDLARVPGVDVVMIAMAARVIDKALSQMGGSPSENQSAALTALSKTIKTFQRSHKKVLFLVDNPYVIDPLTCVQRFFPRLLGRQPKPCDILRKTHDDQYVEYFKFVNGLRSKVKNVEFIDPTDLLCDSQRCPVISDGKFLYSDRDHYSDYGSRMVAKRINTHLIDRATK